MSKFCGSDVRKCPEFHEVRLIFKGWAYGASAVYQSIHHCPEDRHKSAKMQHDNIVTAAGQSAEADIYRAQVH